MATTPMIAPDGTVADVPNEHVDALVAKGGKIGVDMLSPDGKERATVPQEHAQDLVKKGATFAPPAGTPGMPKPDAIKADAANDIESGDVFRGAIGGNPLPLARGAVHGAVLGANLAAPMVTAGASLPVQSAVQGALGAASSAVEGGSAKDIATQGVIGAAIPAVAKWVPTAIQGVKNYLDVPGAISKDVAASLNVIAQKEGLPAVKSQSAREALDEMQHNFMDRAKARYKVVDDAVGGDLKPVQERINDLKVAIRNNKSINPQLAEDQNAELIRQTWRLNKLVDTAEANGIANAKDVMKQADKDYAQAMATKKVADGVKTASGVSKMGNHPHPGGFASQVDRLERTGTLQRALGPEGADAMVQTAKAGLKQAKNIQTGKTVAKVGLGIAGASTITKLGVDALSGH